MRGEILTFDPATGAGLISGDDGARYSFSNGSLSGGSASVGARVDFVGVDGSATDIMVIAAAAPSGFGVGVAGHGPGAAPAYNFGQAMFAVDGRLRRSHFWISWAILFVGGFVLGLIPFVNLIAGLVLIWPNIAIQCKRLHDMGKTGWWVVAPILINIVGIFVGLASVMPTIIANQAALEREDPAAVMALIGPMFGVIGILFLINLAFLIWIGVTDSQPGSNRFGPNPKGVQA